MKAPAFGGTGGFCQAVKRLYSEGAGLFAAENLKRAGRVSLPARFYSFFLFLYYYGIDPIEYHFDEW